ncbi:MAG: IPT/TIG domain-containing protein [Acidobacteriota bacterium]
MNRLFIALFITLLFLLIPARLSLADIPTTALNGTKAEKKRAKAVPKIVSLSPDIDRLEGGAQVTIKGKNFTRDCSVILGDSIVTTLKIKDRQTIQFQVPPQEYPGGRILTIKTKNGIAQAKFTIIAKPLSELANGQIATVAGGISYLGDGLVATDQAVGIHPLGIVMDNDGNIFIADADNHHIRRIDAKTGIITTFAGIGVKGFAGDGGPAILASLNYPADLAIDKQGNLFIADVENNRVRRIDARTTIITTVAGNGINGFAGDGGLATQASLAFPRSILLDKAGNLLISDNFAHVRKVDAATGIISTIVGNGSIFFSGDGGKALDAGIDPAAMVFDSQGNLLIADIGNRRIRKVDASTGIISTIAGNGSGGLNGDGGLATNASLSLGIPSSLKIDGEGNLIFSDTGNHAIRKVDLTRGIINIVAGTGINDFNGDSGPAINASLSFPTGLVIDKSGNLIISNTGHLFLDIQGFNRLRRIDAKTGIITTIAGNGNKNFNGDNNRAVGAGIDFLTDFIIFPFSVPIDKAGNFYVTDVFNNRIRKIDGTSGIITTIAGNGKQGFSGDGGPATEASLNVPTGIALDSAGNLFVVDSFNSRIRKIDAITGIITTVVGNGSTIFNGDGRSALETSILPAGLAFDSAGNLFFADAGNNRVRRVDAQTNIITTVAGNGNLNFSGDGGPATDAGLAIPVGVALDAADNLIILDAINNRIRRVDAQTKIITTIAGNGTVSFNGDNISARNAGISPVSIVTDSSDNIIFADPFNNRVRRIDNLTGNISTIAGIGPSIPNKGRFSGDNGQAIQAGLYSPCGLGIDIHGNIFIQELGSNSVRVVKGGTTTINDLTMTEKNIDATLKFESIPARESLFLNRTLGIPLSNYSR